MVKTTASALLLAAALALAPGTARAQDGAAPTAHAKIKCTCRFQGRDYELGQQACIKAPDGPQLARCSKVLNNTSWNFTGLPCTLARTGQPATGYLAASGLGANHR